jgi:hypothetical protein
MKIASLLKLGGRFAVLLFILFIQGCDQNNVTLNNELSYPTTYKKLDIETLKLMRTEFAKANPYLDSSINDFGFCGFLDSLLQAQWPARIPDLTRSEAINVAKSFISQNATWLGIKASDVFTFSIIDSSTIYEGSLKWYISANFQNYGGLEVYDTNIYTEITDGKVTSCSGNWYPYIYIPSKFNIDNIATAKAAVLNKIVYIWDIAGRPISITITAESLQTAEFSRMILPINTTDKIELHIVWVINIPKVYYVIYLDVMSGEIIGGYPTLES